MRRALLILISFLVLCGFKAYIDSGIIDRWYFIDDLTSSSGVDVSITSASPPAVMIASLDSETEPFLVIPEANESLPGPYGLYIPPAVDNLTRRGSFETCDGNNHPVGWNINEYQNSTLDCSTDYMAGGFNSVKIVVTNIPSAVRMLGACIEIDNSKDYILHAWVYGHSDDENWSMGFYEYSGTDCTGTLAYGGQVESNLDIPAGWTKRGGLMQAASWNVSTQSVSIALQCNDYPRTGDTTIYLDEVNLYEASNSYDSSCTCDTDLPCSCSAIVASISTLATAGTWQFEGVVQSPVDGADSLVRYIFHTPATAGNQNKMQLYWSSEVLTLDVWTSGGVQKTATVAAAGDADTPYFIKAYHTDTGRIGVCWAGSCGTETTGAITVTPHETTYIGDSTGSNIWIDDIVWSRRLTEPIGTQ